MSAAQEKRQGEYGVALERDVMVPMRDGIRLATDLYRPTRDGAPVDDAYPIILERTPYDKSAPSRSEKRVGQSSAMSRATVAEYFVRHGYVVVYQDCRGRFASEGGFTKYLDDAADGYDTVAWLVEQPWCNGRVGTMGLSYCAHTQAALACLNPPGLSCMFLDSGGFSNAYQGGIRQGGAFDQREDPRFFGCQPPFLPLSARPDVLVFETPPLEEALEVVGPIQVKLWVSSDCPDTDFTAKLIDVYPPNEDYPEGFAMILTSGILRCRYRESWERPRMMTPGEICEITIEPFPTGNLFAAGHRLRLDIASSDFPHFDVNTNTGEPEGLARCSRIATNTVHMESTHPSHILLPIVPR